MSRSTKSVVALVQVACVVATLPTNAQEFQPTPAPLARALAREAARLALEPPPATPAVQRQPPPTDDWSRVRRLKPGTAIVITLRGSSPAERYVAASDDLSLELINVTPLPPDAAQAVVRVARDYPLFTVDARRGGVSAGRARLSPAGVSVSGQKVAELDQVLERAERSNVAEVSIARTEGWSPRRKALVGTGAAVAAIGAIILAIYVHKTNLIEEEFNQCMATYGPRRGPSPCDAYYLSEYSNQKAVGGVVLAAGAIVMLAGASSSRGGGVIYRAP